MQWHNRRAALFPRRPAAIASDLARPRRQVPTGFLQTPWLFICPFAFGISPHHFAESV